MVTTLICRPVVCVCNMKPAKMRGIVSAAMVLCAESEDGSVVEIITPPAGAAPGERVTVAGFTDGEPDEQLNPKKKVIETVLPECTTDKDMVVTYRGRPLVTSAGPCVVKSICGAKVK